MGQIATVLNRMERGQGQFPSQPEINPRGQEHTKAVTILRSGKVIDSKVEMPKEVENSTKEGLHEDDQTLRCNSKGVLSPLDNIEEAKRGEKFVAEGRPAEKVPKTHVFASTKLKNTVEGPTLKEDVFHPPLPFPQRARQEKRDKYMGDIME